MSTANPNVRRALELELAMREESRAHGILKALAAELEANGGELYISPDRWRSLPPAVRTALLVVSLDRPEMIGPPEATLGRREA